MLINDLRDIDNYLYVVRHHQEFPPEYSNKICISPPANRCSTGVSILMLNLDMPQIRKAFIIPMIRASIITTDIDLIVLTYFITRKKM